MEVFQNGGTPANECKSSILIIFRCSMIKASILWNPHCRKPPNDRRVYSMNRSDDGPNLPHHSSQPLYSCVLTLFSEMAKPQHLSTSTCPFPKKHATHHGKDSTPFATVFLKGGKQSVIPTQCRSSFARIRSNKCGKNLTRTYRASHLQQESHMQQTRRTI